MNILDENIPKPQRQLLEAGRQAVKQIGVNIGHKGLLDEGIIPLLLTLRRPTFFSRDSDFYSAIYVTTTIASFILRFKNRRALCSFAVYSVIPLSKHGPTGWERSSACLAPEFLSGGDINRKKITWNGNDGDPR